MIIEKYTANKAAHSWHLGKTILSYDEVKAQKDILHDIYISVSSTTENPEYGPFTISMYDFRSELSTPAVFTIDHNTASIGDLVQIKDVELISRFVTYPANEVVILLTKLEKEILFSYQNFDSVFKKHNNLYIGLIHILQCNGLK